MRKLRLEVICSKLHSYHEVDLGIKLIFVWFLIIANWPSWHGHLWRIQRQGQSCPLSRGKWGRLSTGLVIKKGHLNEGDKLNSIGFSKWQVTWVWKAILMPFLVNLFAFKVFPFYLLRGPRHTHPSLFTKRPRELSNFLKITKSSSDGT